jgi:hypothetical protein
MLRIRFDVAPLHAKAQVLARLDVRWLAILHLALLRVAGYEAERLARATPRSLLIPVSRAIQAHMQDRWTVTDHGDHVSIDNPADYAGFVGDEPDIFGARVATYHNRELRAELDAAPENIRNDLAVELPPLLHTL